MKKTDNSRSSSRREVEIKLTRTQIYGLAKAAQGGLEQLTTDLLGGPSGKRAAQSALRRLLDAYDTVKD